jgi:hypothetical protein
MNSLPARLAFAAAIGLAQGLALWWVVEGSGGREALGAPLYYALLAAIAYGPLAMQLNLERLAGAGFWIAGLPLLVLLAAMGGFLGWSAGTLESPWWMREDHVFQFWLASAIVGVAALALVAAWADSRPVRDYAAWFQATTTNIVLLLQAALFAAVGYALLYLCGELFDLIGIDLIEELLDEDVVLYPLWWIMFGIGAQAVAPEALAWLKRHVLNVLGWLLPVAGVIAVAFLAALPFTGLEPLWQTGSATFLLLAIAIVVILLVNAAWQDGREERPMGWLTRRALSVVLLALPVYAALAGHSLALRVMQHGWSVDRVWAAVVVLGVGLFGLGYALAGLGRRWPARLGTVNGFAVLAVALALVLLHTPVLDPKAIAAASQTARLAEGQVKAEAFDFAYLRFALGRPGAAALDRLAALEDHPEAAAIRERVAAALAASDPGSMRGAPPPDLAQLRERIKLHPAGSTLDEGFLAALTEAGRGVLRNEDWKSLHRCVWSEEDCPVLRIDLDADGRDEFLVLAGGSRWRVFSAGDGTWKAVGTMRYAAESPFVDPREALALHAAVTVPHVWHDLRLGETLYTFDPQQE